MRAAAQAAYRGAPASCATRQTTSTPGAAELAVLLAAEGGKGVLCGRPSSCAIRRRAWPTGCGGIWPLHEQADTSNSRTALPQTLAHASQHSMQLLAVVSGLLTLLLTQGRSLKP